MLIWKAVKKQKKKTKKNKKKEKKKKKKKIGCFAGGGLKLEGGFLWRGGGGGISK